MYDCFGGHWGMGFGGIAGIIILGLIVWFVLKEVNSKNSPSQPNEKSPLDILKERYAKGEIDKDEFEEKKKDLM